MPKISVIIPVFNVASYLAACLESCIHSTLHDVEFICIDDGSTDNSLSILQQYAAKDKRFTILSQKNSGQGVARNRGLQAATGEYVAFVDPDDSIDPTLFEKTYYFAKFHQADVVQFNYTEYRENTQKFKPINLEKKFKKEYHYNLLKEGKYNQYTISHGLFYNLYNQVWNRIYRRDFLTQHQICFATTRNGEDHLFTIAVLIQAPAIYYLADYLYIYRIRMLSACHSWKKIDIQYTFDNIQQIAAYLRAHNLYDKYYAPFRSYCIQTLVWTRSSLQPEWIENYESQVKQMLTPSEFNLYRQLCAPRKTLFAWLTHIIKKK